MSRPIAASTPMPSTPVAMALVTLTLVTWAVAGLLPAAAAGLPLLSEAESIAGLRLFPDHRDAALWWYAPGRLELVQEASGPAFRLERYSYTGTTATGDSGTLWWKGALGLRVRLTTSPDEVATARQILGRRLRHEVALRPVPIERIDSVLLYASAGETEASGELEGGDWEGDAERWTERAFLLGLTPETTELLWEAFHDEGLAMSLGYSLSATAMPHRPAADPFGGEAEVVEPALATFAGDALAIRVSPADCPHCFVSTELDAAVTTEYPYLEARCYDFVSGLAPSDLGLVIAEVRATAVTGDRLSEQVRFEPARPTSQPVHFRLAVDLGGGYSYRVVRVFDDGHAESTAWMPVESWSGILDVSEYRRTAAAFDARQLY